MESCRPCPERNFSNVYLSLGGVFFLFILEREPLNPSSLRTHDQPAGLAADKYTTHSCASSCLQLSGPESVSQSQGRREANCSEMGHKTHGVTGPTPEIYLSVCVCGHKSVPHIYSGYCFHPQRLALMGGGEGGGVRVMGGGVSAVQTQTREGPRTAQWRPVCAAGSVEKRP